MQRCANILLFVLLLGVAGLFVIKKPNGQTWLSMADFVPNTAVLTAQINSWLGRAERKVARGINNNTHTGKTKVYKWRDSAGYWHVSDQPINAAGGLDEMIHVDPDTNLIQGAH